MDYSGTEFPVSIGLRSQMYYYVKDNEKGGKTAEGIKKYVVKKISNMKIINMYFSITNRYVTKWNYPKQQSPTWKLWAE